jgi:hypothetical protein
LGRQGDRAREVSFGFQGKILVVSIEMRKAKGKRYQPSAGLFRQYNSTTSSPTSAT